MKAISLLITVCFIAITSFGQAPNKTERNLDFEQVENGKAVDWQTFGKGEYNCKIDTVISQSGKNSVSIEYKGGTPNFNAWTYTIPAIYKGKKIKLIGYIKTENVTDGFAGLWMRIDPKVGFDNMNNRGIKGTTDWKKYEVELDLNPSKAKRIVFGGLLVGKGKMWIDNLMITIDGKKLDDIPLRKLSKQETDTEFNNGSKINSIALNEQKIEDLQTLGLIWGFLKYYHPNIAAGNYNWDFELFRILPKVLEAKSTSERDEYLTEWINTLGEFDQTVKEKKQKAEIKLYPDIDWITHSKFSTELTSVLTNVKNAKRTGWHYYVGLGKGAGNPIFKNEVTYSNMKYPDAGFRLLSLYRYWNIIQYYFPYKNLIEEDWKNVLSEFIPEFVNAENEIEYKLAVLALIGRVGDTHANIWGNDTTLEDYWGANYAPIEIAFIENKAVVTNYYDEELGRETGLAIGDNIIKINNESVADLVKERFKYTPASNYPTQLRDLGQNLLRTNDSTLNIEFLRNGGAQTKTIKTFSTNEINIYQKYVTKDTCFKLISSEVAYIDNGALKREYLPEIWKKIENTKGLIIDVRNYPSDFPLYGLCDYLMPKATPFATVSNGNITTPGLFTFKNPLNTGKKNKKYYKGKVIIIVNETSQSSSEFHAMAYRVHPNATVIGSTTAGADGNVSDFYLPGNIKTMISGIGIYYPDKTETQRIGIVPDIEVKPTIEGIKNNKDELLEKAIELIEE